MVCSKHCILTVPSHRSAITWYTFQHGLWGELHVLVGVCNHIHCIAYNRCGPLSHIWCMRFEAKHRFFKYLTKVLGNFKNVAKTLTNRHQRHMCYVLANPAFLVDTVDTGPGKCNFVDMLWKMSFHKNCCYFCGYSRVNRCDHSTIPKWTRYHAQRCNLHSKVHNFSLSLALVLSLSLALSLSLSLSLSLTLSLSLSLCVCVCVSLSLSLYTF